MLDRKNFLLKGKKKERRERKEMDRKAKNKNAQGDSCRECCKNQKCPKRKLNNWKTWQTTTKTTMGALSCIEPVSNSLTTSWCSSSR